MKIPLVKSLCALAAGLTSLVSANAQPPITVGINPNYSWPWIGYMNVFGLNGDGSPNYGAFQFGQTWGTADLRAAYSGTNLYITLNTNVWNPTNTYWVNPDGTPNKWMDASFYVEDDTLSGWEIIFSGTCVSNTLSAPNATSVAFIKDFDLNYNLIQSQTASLQSGQPFSITLFANANHHIQYGFETQGPDVDPTNLVNTGIVILDQYTNFPSVAQILSQTAIPGQNVTFTAVAKGTTPFSYQWSFGGQDIDGATNSTLTLTNVQLADAGTYSILVTNEVGAGETIADLTMVSLAQFATNILLDPGFESGKFASSSTAGWVGFNGTFFDNTNGTYYEEPTNYVTVVDGTNCFGVYSTGAGSYNGCYQDRPATAGDVYTGYMWMLSSPGPAQITGSDTCILEVQFRDSTGGNILEDFQSAPITASTPPGVWIKMLPTNAYSGDFTTLLGTPPYMVAPPNTASVRFQMTYHAASGGNIFADAADLRLREPVSTTSTTASQFQISFPTLTGPTYNVFYKNNLTDASWTLLTTVTGDGTVKTVTDVRSAAQRFYIVNTK